MQAEPRRAILVCEDDEGIRELLVEALQAEGFAVDAACDGWETLERLNQAAGRYLVLLDLLMPGISGYEILERMADDPHLCGEHSIIVISATGFIRPMRPGVIEKQLIKSVLQKPFELDDLLALVQRWA